MSSSVMSEQKDSILIITLNRPEKKNSVDTPMLQSLRNEMEEIGDIRAVIIRGASGCFCAGGDMGVLHSGPEPLEELVSGVQSCCSSIRQLPMPVIAVVEGHAIGAGMALAMACDMVVAQERAVFNTGFVKIGLAPGCGTLFAPSLMGYHKACELYMLGGDIEARTAERIGMVNIVAEDAMGAALDLARHITSMPPGAVSRTKKLLANAYTKNAEEQFWLERECIVETSLSEFFKKRIVEKQSQNNSSCDDEKLL